MWHATDSMLIFFKTTFPHTAPPAFEEWAINISIQIDTDS